MQAIKSKNNNLKNNFGRIKKPIQSANAVKRSHQANQNHQKPATNAQRPDPAARHRRPAARPLVDRDARQPEPRSATRASQRPARRQPQHWQQQRPPACEPQAEPTAAQSQGHQPRADKPHRRTQRHAPKPPQSWNQPLRDRAQQDRAGRTRRALTPAKPSHWQRRQRGPRHPRPYSNR